MLKTQSFLYVEEALLSICFTHFRPYHWINCFAGLSADFLKSLAFQMKSAFPILNILYYIYSPVLKILKQQKFCECKDKTETIFVVFSHDIRFYYCGNNDNKCAFIYFDGSNPKSGKLLPNLLDFVDLEIGFKFRILHFASLPGETFQISLSL